LEEIPTLAFFGLGAPGRGSGVKFPHGNVEHRLDMLAARTLGVNSDDRLPECQYRHGAERDDHEDQYDGRKSGNPRGAGTKRRARLADHGDAPDLIAAGIKGREDRTRGEVDLLHRSQNGHPDGTGIWREREE
jgi:hypothetical protein